VATVGDGGVYTLQDLISRQDPKGSLASIVDILAEKNEMLEDIPWFPSNNKTSHILTQSATEPSGTWRLLNKGVAREAGTDKQITEGTGMLETMAACDRQIARLSGDIKKYRWQNDKKFIRGLSKSMQTAFIYGNADSDPEQITGIAPRYDSTSGTHGDNIIDAGETDSGGMTSIYLINWGEDQVFGIYPEGSKAGLQVEDLGLVTLEDGDGNEYMGYKTHYEWHCGLVVANWKYVVRIANVDVSALTKNAASGSDLVDLMTQALELIEDLNGKPAFYCNRTIRSVLRRQIKNSNNVNITMDQVAGKRVLAFDEVPVRRVDKILSTEATVS